jgi:hypothetical protein
VGPKLQAQKHGICWQLNVAALVKENQLEVAQELALHKLFISVHLGISDMSTCTCNYSTRQFWLLFSVGNSSTFVYLHLSIGISKFQKERTFIFNIPGMFRGSFILSQSDKQKTHDATGPLLLAQLLLQLILPWNGTWCHWTIGLAHTPSSYRSS